MSVDDTTIQNNPDQFARELHRCLLTEGPRSPGVRRLMRIARKHQGAELERILETKINEFRRHQREIRIPTAWNAPLRGWEWLCDHVALTPPRDVLMTLVYVVIAVLGIELAKSRFVSSGETLRPDLATLLQTSGIDATATMGVVGDGGPHPADLKFDDWLTLQIVKAADTRGFSQVLQKRIQETLDNTDLPSVFKEHIESLQLRTQLHEDVERFLQSDGFRERLAANLVATILDTGHEGGAAESGSRDDAMVSGGGTQRVIAQDLHSLLRQEIRAALRESGLDTEAFRNDQNSEVTLEEPSPPTAASPQDTKASDSSRDESTEAIADDASDPAASGASPERMGS